MSVIQSAISSIRRKADEILNDNQGWFRGGKFTPGQQIQTIQQQSAQQPLTSVGPFVVPNWRNEQGKDVYKSFGKGIVNTSTFGLVQPKYEPQTAYGKYANVLGNVTGFFNPLSPGGLAMKGLDKVGGNLITKFAPKLTTNLAGKVIGGLGKEALQTGAYTAGKIASQATGLSPQSPINAKTIGQDFLLGSAMRGVFSPEIGNVLKGVEVPTVKGISPDVWTSDKTLLNEAKQKLRLGMDTAEFKKIDDGLTAMAKNYGLESFPDWKKLSFSKKVDILDNRLSEMANSGFGVKMGFAQEGRSKLKNLIEDKVKVSDPYSASPEEVKKAEDAVNSIYNGLLKSKKDKDFINKVKALRARLNEQLYKVAGADATGDYKTNYALYQNIRGTDIPQSSLLQNIEGKISDLDEIIANGGKIPKIKITDQPIKTGIGGEGKIDIKTLKTGSPLEINGQKGTVLQSWFSVDGNPIINFRHENGSTEVINLDKINGNIKPQVQLDTNIGVNKVKIERKPATPPPKGVGTIGKGIVPQTESIPAGKLKIKANTQPTKAQQSSRLPETVAPATSKVSQLSISKKGKLNTSKLNLPEEQKVAIDTLQDNVPVTVIGNKDVVKQSVMTKGRKTVMTDDQMKVRLAEQLNTRQEVVSLSKQYDKLKQSGASELELISLKNKIIDQSRIAQQQGTFAGRLLQAQNILANELATPEQKIYALLDNAGIDSKTYIKEAIKVDFNDANQVVNFYRKFVPPKFGEILDEIRYTNMLSSPLTHIINTSSNILQSGIVKPVEKTITGALDFVSSKLTGKERQYFASQGVDYTKGYIRAIPEAWKKFKSIASGSELSLRPDLEYIPAGTKGALKWYTTPLRLLEASDQFFRTLVTTGEQRSLARLKLPESELLKRASQSADYTLFRQKFDPSGELGQGTVLKTWDKWNSAIQNLRRVPGGKWVIPFLQTPTNILKQGLEYSPLGVSTMVGAKRPLEQLSKAIVGTTVFATLYGIADKGGTTWDTPTNPKEKELFYAAGLQPYSVKIGDKWVSYSKLGPLAYPMAMASALKWVEKNNPDQNVAENLRDALGQMLGFFSDQSYVQSVGDLVSTIQSATPNKLATGVSAQLTNFAGQLVPYRAFQGWLARLIDPVYRKPEGMAQSLASQIPGLSQNVPAYTDLQGQPSKRDLPVINSFSPVKIGVEKPEAKQMLDVKESTRIDRAVQTKALRNNQVSETNPTGNLIVYTNENGNPAELDLTRYDTIASLPTTNKYNSAIKESKQYSEAAKILDNSYLSQEQQQVALTRLGIEPDKARYYQIANDSDNLKTMFVLDEINKVKTAGGGFGDVIQLLSQQRTEVNNKMIASNGVIDNLVDEGILTKAQATELKKYKFENGTLTKKTKSVARAKKPKKISVTLRKVSPVKIARAKVKRISVPKKTYKVIKPRKLKVLRLPTDIK